MTDTPYNSTSAPKYAGSGNASLDDARAEIARLTEEVERHRKDNLVRAVLKGWSEEVDGRLTDYINEEGFDPLPWRIAVRNGEEAQKLTAANARLRQQNDELRELLRRSRVCVVVANSETHGSYAHLLARIDTALEVGGGDHE